MYKLRNRIYLPMIILIMMALVFTGCSNSVQPTSANAIAESGQVKNAKYVFLFIGDGLSMTQTNAAEIYLGATAKKSANPDLVKLQYTQFPAQGMTTTYAADSFIPDSASAGTAIATGNKTNDGVINMDPTKKIKYKAISEMAKEKGFKVGVVSSVSLDHATPAVFYAHNPSRNNYYEIGMELAKSNFDYFGGGGFKQPKGKDGNQPDIIEAAKNNGFKVVTTKEEILKLNSNAGKVIAINPELDKDKALTYDINRKDSLSLADFTRKGIEVLDNPNGFFMMVEGGKIDWAGHANDAAAVIHDVIALDEAIAEALKFAEKHPQETLIVVTGDHETGGMTIGFAGTKYETAFEKISNQKMSYDEFDKKIEEYRKNHTPENTKLEDWYGIIKENFGLEIVDAAVLKDLEQKAKDGDKEAAKKLGVTLTEKEVNDLKAAFAMSMKEAKERGTDEQTYLLYGGYEPFSITLTHILNQKAGIGWTTYSHTGVPVPTYAKGVGENLFQGYYDDTDIFKKLVEIMGLK